MKEVIRNAPDSATRYHTYLTLNPLLEVHSIYTDCTVTIPDFLRISFTRFRLSSHMLKIETGRWSRTPREERLCKCGTSLQNEQHVFACPLVSNIRNSLSKPCATPNEFFEDTTVEDLRVLHKLLDLMPNFHNDSPSD